MSETSKLFNKLLISKHKFVKSNTIKSRSNFHKSPELLPLKGENPFPLFIDFDGNIVFKRGQIETRFQEEVLKKGGCELHLLLLSQGML